MINVDKVLLSSTVVGTFCDWLLSRHSWIIPPLIYGTWEQKTNEATCGLVCPLPRSLYATKIFICRKTPKTNCTVHKISKSRSINKESFKNSVIMMPNLSLLMALQAVIRTVMSKLASWELYSQLWVSRHIALISKMVLLCDPQNTAESHPGKVNFLQNTFLCFS